MIVEGTQALVRVTPRESGSERVSSVSSVSTSSNVLDRPAAGSQGKEGASSLPVGNADLVEIAENRSAPTARTGELSREDNPNAVSGVADSATAEDRAKLEEETREKEREQLSALTDKANEKLDESLSLRFRQDEKTGADVVQLIEQESGDVVRQFPPKEALEFMKRFEETVSGMLVSKQA